MKRNSLYISIIILSLAFVSPADMFAQIGHYPPDRPWNPEPKQRLGKDKMEFVYKHTVTDTDPEETQEYMEILQVGDEFSVYQDFKKFRLDSVRVYVDTLNAKEQEMYNLYRAFCGNKNILDWELVLNDKKILEFTNAFFPIYTTKNRFR